MTIKKTNLYSEPYMAPMKWERSHEVFGESGWTLEGGLVSGHIRIRRPSPRSLYRIIFDNDIVLATEQTLIEAQHRALAEMEVLLHREKQMVGIKCYYASMRRHSLKRWKDGKI